MQAATLLPRRTSNQTKGNIMRMLMIVSLPNAKFNAAVKDGTAAAKMGKIMEAIKPEAAYFADAHGHRTGYLVVDCPDASKIPSLAEPWFLTFDADIHMHPCMTPDDLKKAGLDALGKQWG
jgi:hypothetical protein